MTPFFAAATSGPDYWPFAVLLISVALIIVMITVLRMHAFMALIFAAMTAGLLARTLPGEPALSHWVQAVELTASEFGTMAGKIGVVIALAALIGMCLMESGAADKVVRRFIALFGEKHAGTAIFLSGYILSIPIFFDTFFMLLLPLAVAMRLRTGKNYLLYIMAICCGGVVTHSLIVPHPGPLAMAESLKLDLGLTIGVGIITGLIPATASWLVMNWLNRRMEVPLRETIGTSLDNVRAIINKPESELPSFVAAILPVVLPIILISTASTFIAIQGKGFDANDLKDGSALVAKLRAGGEQPIKFLRDQLTPGALAKLEQVDVSRPLDASASSVLLNELNRIIRTGGVSVGQGMAAVKLRAEAAPLMASADGENLTRLNRMVIEDAFPNELTRTEGMNPALFKWGDFLGNRNVALIIGAVFAIWVMARQRGLALSKIMQMAGPPLETAGVIILITSAGGAFGLMLKNAGVGDAVKALVEGKQVNLILLSWAVAAVIRVAQGSATVAMLTTAAMVYPIMSTGAGLAYNPVYIFMSIGFGAMFLSWMNDSGFWVVGRLSGFTEKETLQTWTVAVTVNSVVGLLVCLLGSAILPLK